jgi:hypothetical protein
MSALKPVLVKDLNRDHLRSKNVEFKIQRLVDINREEDDYHLFNKRQSRETVRQLRKSRKVRSHVSIKGG